MSSTIILFSISDLVFVLKLNSLVAIYYGGHFSTPLLIVKYIITFFNSLFFNGVVQAFLGY